MKFELVIYKCAQCGNTFKAAAIGSGSYGEFLLRSDGAGAEAYLDALSDKTYDQVDKLLEVHPMLAGKSALKRAEILRSIYGAIACDPDEHGNSFIIGGRPRCPVCGSQKMESWEFTDPIEFVELDIPPVTHQLWNALSDEEKINRVDQYLHSSKLA
jgi:hypothetical protein